MASIGYIILGAILGGLLFHGATAELIVGAALGGLFGLVQSLRQRVAALEADIVAPRAPRPARDRMQAAHAVTAPESPPHEEARGRASGDLLNVRAASRPESVEPGAQPHGTQPQTSPPPKSAKLGAATSMAPAITPMHEAAGPASDSDAAPRDLKPSSLELLSVIKDWLAGNVPAALGVVLSVCGAGFLIKEAIDRRWLVLPIELRLIGVALFGSILLAVGWCLRKSRPTYAVIVQGGGFAVLYLTIYAAFALYALLPAGLAFALLVIVTAAAGVLAVLQDARALAVLGIVGGFGAPVLVSSSAGDHVALFTYYAILNAAVLGIAWFRSWRALNVLGFLFTFIVASLWGYVAYRPEHFMGTEPFLIVFVLMYTFVPVLFALRQAPELRGFVDGTLVFGTPLVGFGLQSQLVAGTDFGLAISALVWAGGYVALAAVLRSRRPVELRVLTEAFLSLGMVFLAIAVPLALDAGWTSVAWSVQGAAMIWLGHRQRRPLAYVVGALLQAGAAAAYALAFQGGELPVLNGTYLTALVIALAAWWSSFILNRAEQDETLRVPALVSWVALVWGSLWWFAAGFNEIDRFLAARYDLPAALALIAASALAAMLVGRRWPRFNSHGLLLVPSMVFVFVLSLESLPHPLANFGSLAWALSLASHITFLRYRETQFAPLASGLHTIGIWVLAGLLLAEVHWSVARVAAGVWPEAAAMTAVAVSVFALLRLVPRNAWPLSGHATSYLIAGPAAALVFVGGMALAYLALSPGQASPLPYVPIINPLELAALLVFFCVARWYRAASALRPNLVLEPHQLAVLGGGFGFVFLTSVVARCVHHFAAVPFQFDALAASTVMQAALSIVWGSAALLAMLSGAKSGRRAIWMLGAMLMTVVVVKLFLVELDNTGTFGRVVSFLGVGLLLLIVGYFAPVPPRKRGEATAS